MRVLYHDTLPNIFVYMYHATKFQRIYFKVQILYIIIQIPG